MKKIKKIFKVPNKTYIGIQEAQALVREGRNNIIAGLSAGKSL